MDSKKTIRYIFQIAGRTRWKIGLLIFIQAIISAVNVSSALILRNVIDAAIAGNTRHFFFHMAIFVSVICIRVLAWSANRFLQEDVRSELENKWKNRLFSVLLEKDYACISSVHSGEWMTRLTNDTVIAANGMTSLLPDIGGMIIKLIGALVAILLLEPRFLYLLIPGGVLLIAISVLFRKKMKQLHKAVQEQDGKLRTYMQECFAGMLVVRSYGTEQSVIQQAADKMQKHKATRMTRNRFSNFCNTGFSAFMNVVYVAGACFCGYGILRHTISYGTFMAILQLVGQLQGPLANIGGILPRFYAMISSVERLIEAETLDDAHTGKRKTLKEIQEIYQNKLEKIVLKHISFSYPRPMQSFQTDDKNQKSLCDLTTEKDTTPAVSEWNFEIKKGTYAAITGPSGCGKSTLFKLLMCLYEPDAGARYVQLDGEKIPLDGSWQRLFAYVPQGNYLMSGTIREMVAFSDLHRMKEEPAMWEALSIACADTFVRKLAKGLDTVLGERGAGLSEGQMQRLAIARAVFSGCPFLILDECSSSLDESTEKQLLINLRAMTDRTVIIITHRPAALQICDQIWHIHETLSLMRGDSN